MMPLTPDTPSPASLRALERGLRKIARRGVGTALARAHARLAVRSVVEMRRGIRLFSAEVEDLAAAKPLARVARPVGWRFFVPGLRLGQSAEVRRVGNHLEMTRWIEGPDNRWFLELVDALATDRCAERRYRLRCLEVAALHLLAVWAYRNPSDQWLVPVSPLPSALPSGQALDGEAFEGALTEQAADRLAIPDGSLA